MSRFHTYIDWTTEDIPRAFYIGKGNEFRTRKPDRNQKHKHVCKEFGFRREIVFSSDSEKECLEKEISLIKEHHTFYRDDLADKEIACNFTTGGDGAAGWLPTDSQRENISAAIKKAHQKNPEYSEGISKRAKIRMKDPDFVRKVSERIKEAFRKMPQEKFQEIHRKAGLANIGRISPQRGEGSWRTTLTDELVQQIRREYDHMIKDCKKVKVVKNLCEKYQQGYNTIFKIVSGVTWKHVEV